MPAALQQLSPARALYGILIGVLCWHLLLGMSQINPIVEWTFLEQTVYDPKVFHSFVYTGCVPLLRLSWTLYYLIISIDERQRVAPNLHNLSKTFITLINKINKPVRVAQLIKISRFNFIKLIQPENRTRLNPAT